MQTENSTFDRKSNWQWLPLGYRTQYDWSIKISADQVRHAAEQIIRDILPQEFRSAQVVTDMRGKEVNREALSTGSVFPQPKNEEALCIVGTYPLPRDEQESSEEEPREGFTIRYSTKFHGFDGAKHIQHSVERTRTELTNDPGSELSLILDSKAEIFGARLGLEFFEARFLTVIGFSPVATKMVQVEATERHVKVRIVAEGLKTKQAPPLPSGILERTLNFLSKLGVKELPNFSS